MEMTGEYRIAAPRAKVWAALNDPEVLKISIPGCESLDKTSDNEMTAKVVSKIGPVKATFTGKVRLENINPPESYTIAGEGQGGVAGFAKGGADVKLTEDGSETILTYTARAQIGGKLAQLGSRLIDSTAKMMADQFFAKFSAVVGEQSAASAEAPASAEPVIAIEAAEAPVAAPLTAEAPGVATASASSSASASASSTSRASAAPVSRSAPAPAPSGSSMWTWLVPIITLVIGVIIGRYMH